MWKSCIDKNNRRVRRRDGGADEKRLMTHLGWEGNVAREQCLCLSGNAHLLLPRGQELAGLHQPVAVVNNLWAPVLSSCWTERQGQQREGRRQMRKKKGAVRREATWPNGLCQYCTTEAQ